MSHTPTDSEDEQTDPYIEGWRATNYMVRQGRSWSGRERNCVFLNEGTGRFADISAAAGLDFSDDGRSIAVTDWDADGDMDLWLRNRTSPGLRFMRNELKSKARSVQIELAAAGENPNAIGARLEVHTTGGEAPMIRSVRAGEGFRSQASRWQHFGLGVSDEVTRIGVRWPDGSRDEYDGTTVPGRYRIRQGSDTLESVTWGMATSALHPEPVPTKPVSGQSRVVVLGPVPAPTIAFEEPDGGSAKRIDFRGQPVLLNLWATWCASCRGELSEITEGQPELQLAGLQVLALNVENYGGEEESPEPEALKSYMKKLSFPFQWANAMPKTIATLEIVEQAVLGHRRPLNLPRSYLIDGEGNLAVIYVGPASVEQVIADAKILREHPGLLAATALPAGGRWHDRPRHSNLEAIAKQLVGGGYPREGERVYQAWTGVQQSESLAEQGAKTLMSGDAANGLREWNEALRMNPRYFWLHVKASELYTRLGGYPEAIDHARQALAMDPTHSDARRALGNALLGEDPSLLPESDDEAEARAEVVAVLDQASLLRELGSPAVARHLLLDARQAYAESSALRSAIEEGLQP